MGLREYHHGSPREVAHAISLSRRNFLRSVTGAGAAAALFGASRCAEWPRRAARKRWSSPLAEARATTRRSCRTGRRTFPHLLNELIPQATFFTQVVNRGILGHYVATASIVTGVYETFNNFASVSPGNPTVFEYFRKDLKRPATDCWVVAPSNGFARIGESAHKSFGPGLGAGVILPKRLLSAALSAGARWRALPAPPARQLRDAAVRAHAGRPADRTESDGRSAQALGGRFRRARAQPGEPRRDVRVRGAGI